MGDPWVKRLVLALAALVALGIVLTIVIHLTLR